MGASQFRELLEQGDVDGLRSAWRKAAPHLPQPETRADAEIAMHHARTASETVSLRARQYSHSWLTERNHPSALPVDKHPPRIAEAVGISISTRNELLRPAAVEIRKAMEDAVSDAYAERRTDVPFVRARMEEARKKAQKQLFGRSLDRTG